MLTLKQKRAISKFVRENHESRNPRNVRFENDGAVTVMVDEMPNTNQAGRIFAGWDKDILKQINCLPSAAATQELVKKVIVSRFNDLPLAIVNVPANVRKVRVAGASTQQGNPVNVWNHSVTASKRSLKLAESLDLPSAEYSEKMDAFTLIDHKF